MYDHVGWLQPVKRERLRLKKRFRPLRFKEGYVNALLSGRSSTPTTYLEIGVRAGNSMVDIRASRRIGVDPAPSVPSGFLRPSDEIHEQTSDDFFMDVSSGSLDLPMLDVVLVDGLHEFKQALRDTMNAAKLMRADGVIVIDDCNPRSAAASVDTPTGSNWNGDVWKVMAIIRETQPQWRALTVDADQGVGLVWGFGEAAEPIDDSVIQDFKAKDYSYLAQDRGRVVGLTPIEFLPEDFPPARLPA